MRDWLKAFFSLGRIARILLIRTKAQMQSLDALTAAIATLSAKVDAHIASDGPKDGEIAALRAELAQIDASLVTATASLAAIEAKLN